MTAKQLIRSGYRVTSRRHCTVSRIDRKDWREYMAREHAPWDPEGEGMKWANSSGMGDFYRRIHSKDNLIVPQWILKLIPNSGNGPDNYIEVAS